MAVKKRFPYRAALVACNGGCRTAKDGQGCADGSFIDFTVEDFA